MKKENIIEALQRTLRDVGRALLEMRDKGPVCGNWEATQLKSEADLVAEKIIIESLHRITPMLPVTSEENLESHSVDRFVRHWLVDPIDGTASFCAGYSGFVTQMALMEDASPVLSAVYAPALDIMYLAERGVGAYVNGSRLSMNYQAGGVCLIDNYPTPRGIAQLVYQKLPCSKYIESGSIGLKICRVAEGKADLFVKDVNVRSWDLAPGQLILKESGGVMHDLRGGEISYSESLVHNSGLIVATSVKCAEETLNLLAKGKLYD